jgi:gas vesicle protein
MTMSKGSNFMSFLSGAVFGAIIALLYAPTSGEELRGQIRDEVDVRWQQASEELDKALENVQESIDEMSGELKAYFEQLSAKSSKVVEQIDAGIDIEPESGEEPSEA